MRLVILLVCFFIYKSLCSEKNIELEVIYEKTFDEPVVDVIFDTATVTIEEAKMMGWKNLEGKKDDERIKIEYPKVIFIPEKISYRKDDTQIKEIRFYNKKGELIKKLQVETDWSKREKVVISPNGKYIGISKQPTEDNPENTGGVLYKADGTLIWEKKTKDSPIAVSDEGYVLSGELDWKPEGTDGSFFIYNPEGEKIKTIENPYRKENIGKGFGKFSNDGKYVILMFTNYKNSIIQLITKSGDILWENEIKYKCNIPNEFDLQENVGLIATTTQVMDGYKEYIFFIEWNGGLKWVIPLENLGRAIIIKIFSESKKACIVSTSCDIYCINLLTGETLWKYKESWAPLKRDKNWLKFFDNKPRYAEGTIMGRYIYIIGKYKDVHSFPPKDWYASTLFVFDFENNKLIQKIEYPDKRITLISRQNEVFISDIDSNKIFKVKIKEAEK